MAYSLPEYERLKGQLYAIASNHQVRGRTTIDLIAKLKANRLTKEDIAVLTKLCRFYDVDYDKLKPIKEERRWKNGKAN